MSEETPGLTVYERYNGSDVLIYQRFAPQATIIERASFPIWAIIGIPGALISIYLWSSRPMRRGGSAAAAVYQACLGVVDLSFLCVHILWYLYVAWQGKVLDFPVMCELFPTINYGIQYLAPVINVTFIFERFLAICYPFRSQNSLIRSSARGALKLTGILVITCLCAASVQSMVFVYKAPTCTTRPELDIEGHIVKILHRNWTFVTEIFFFVLLPTLCLVLNIFVIRVLHQKFSFKRKSISALYRNGSATSYTPHSDVKDGNHINRGVRASTITLLCTSFYMIVANYSVAIALLLGLLLPQGNAQLSDEEIDNDPVWNLYFRLFTIRICIESFSISQFAVKCPIYLATSKQFRVEFLKLFQCFSQRGNPTTQGLLVSDRQQLPSSSSHNSHCTLEGVLPTETRLSRFSSMKLGPIQKQYISFRKRPSSGMSRTVIGANGERVPVLTVNG